MDTKKFEESNNDAEATGEAPSGMSPRAKRSFDRLPSLLLLKERNVF